MMLVAFLIFALLVMSWLLAPNGAEPAAPADVTRAGAGLGEAPAHAA